MLPYKAGATEENVAPDLNLTDQYVLQRYEGVSFRLNKTNLFTMSVPFQQDSPSPEASSLTHS